MTTKAVFTTFEAARMCHVSPLSIINWVNAGKLPAFRTPGGHRRIRREDLVAFMRESGLPLPEELRSASTRPRVLIADDDRNTRDALAHYLTTRARPFEVATTGSTFDAGRLLASFHPDFVVLDLRLAGIDAAQVCRSIKADPQIAGAKVVVTLAHPTPEVRARLIESGVSACFPRPVDAAALSAFIDSQIDQPLRSKPKRSRTFRA
jgi:excisionase family DNA binding protein